MCFIMQEVLYIILIIKIIYNKIPILSWTIEQDKMGIIVVVYIYIPATNFASQYQNGAVPINRIVLTANEDVPMFT